MKPLQKKLARYTAPQEAKAAGIYPYFTPISSEQDTEVIVSGKKVLMFGSNSYLGLTNHPKIKEAAKAEMRLADKVECWRNAKDHEPETTGYVIWIRDQKRILYFTQSPLCSTVNMGRWYVESAG